MVLHGFELKTHLITWVMQMLSRVQKPISNEHVNLKLNASVGVAFYPEDGDNFSTLRRNADLAMYQAKIDEELFISTYKSLTPQELSSI